PLTLQFPGRQRTRGGEKIIQVPGGGNPQRESKLDQALIRAVARAYKWREAMEKGEAKSLSELARKEGCTDDYIRKILKMAFLAPDIVETILKGKQPEGLTLSHILGLDLPLFWEAQRNILEFPARSFA
ncbi:MAG TPA: hypothetical protein DDZ83_09690, partial [Nitrospinae bacterium]|nr:hypothetical protein [Nitrospinota bacterium]